MQPHDPSRLLRLALRANACFSAVSGLVLAAAAPALGPWLGIPPLALAVVGLGLLPFAWLLFRNAARSPLSESEARLAVGADVAWVIGSAALVAFDPLGLTLAGRVAVVVIALCVADFALLQALGLGRLGARRQRPDQREACGRSARGSTSGSSAAQTKAVRPPAM